jgi:hypothetical protein
LNVPHAENSSKGIDEDGRKKARGKEENPRFGSLVRREK